MLLAQRQAPPQSLQKDQATMQESIDNLKNQSTITEMDEM